VSLTLEVPFAESHKHCNVFAYLPYSWADTINHDDCRLPYVVMKSQFKLLLMSIASLHKAGIAHSCIQPSAIRLSHGLIPHIVGFEHAWTPKRKGSKEDRIHSERAYWPPSLGLHELKNGLRGFTLDQMKLLDLYGYAAMMLHAFFKVTYAYSGLIDIENIKYELRDCYDGEINKDEQTKLKILIKYIMNDIVANNMKISVSDIVDQDEWF